MSEDMRTILKKQLVKPIMPKYYWFNSNNNPPCDKQVEAFYGFLKYPDNKVIEDYDLRQVGYCTFDEAIEDCDKWYTF